MLSATHNLSVSTFISVYSVLPLSVCARGVQCLQGQTGSGTEVTRAGSVYRGLEGCACACACVCMCVCVHV